MRCMECGAIMRLTDEPFFESYQRERFEVKGVMHHVCDECGEIELDRQGMEDSRKIADAEYRRIHGLLSPGEIQAIRKSLGLSQKDFETVIGVSSPTVSRWETGFVVQSKPADKLIRMMDSHVCVAQDLVERAELGEKAPAYAPSCYKWVQHAQDKELVCGGLK